MEFFIVNFLKKQRIVFLISYINSYVNGESVTALGEKKEILTVLEAIVKLDKIK